MDRLYTISEMSQVDPNREIDFQVEIKVCNRKPNEIECSLQGDRH